MDGTLDRVYRLPDAVHNRNPERKILCLFYTAFTALINALAYSLRDRELEESFRKVFSKHRDPTGFETKPG